MPAIRPRSRPPSTGPASRRCRSRHAGPRRRSACVDTDGVLTFDVEIDGRPPDDRLTACAIASRRSMAASASTTGRTVVRAFTAGCPRRDRPRSLSARYRMTALTRLWTAGSHVSPSFMKIELMTFSTDRSVRTRSSAIDGVVHALGHLPQDLAFPGGQLIERRRRRARPIRHQTFDDLRVDQRASDRDHPDGRQELVEIVDALLQDVGAPGAARVEQRDRVARVRVLAQDDDAEARVASRGGVWRPGSPRRNDPAASGRR